MEKINLWMTKDFFQGVGFSYFMMVVLTVCCSVSAVTAVVSDCAAGSRSSGYKLAAGYGTAVLVAIPVCAKMMQALPNMQLYRNEMRPGQWIRTLCICIFVMYVEISLEMQ